MSKFLILTDSISNPRPFPASEMTQLEETYPYILRSYFKDSVFWQLSFGSITTEQLIDQAAGYLSNWNPDFIIIQSGINDARPEAFTELQKAVISRFSGRLFSRLSQFVYNPTLIRFRQVSRVSKKSFRKTARKIKLLFEESKIFWLEICPMDGYESARPGVLKRVVEYNQIVKDIYCDDFIMLKGYLLKAGGFNVDNLHWNKQGHRIVADILIKKINSHLPKPRAVLYES